MLNRLIARTLQAAASGCHVLTLYPNLFVQYEAFGTITVHHSEYICVRAFALHST